MTATFLFLLGLSLAQEAPPPDEVAAPDAPAEEVAAPEEPTHPAADEDDDLLDVTEVDENGDPLYLTVTVVGEQQVRAAQDAVMRSMAALGWKSRRKRDGTVVFRGPDGWMGKATLTAMGELEFSQPIIAFDGAMAGGSKYENAPQTRNDAPVGGVGVSTLPLPGKKKVGAIQREIRDEVREDVLAYRRTIQLRHFSTYVSELPERLDALWTSGESLDGGGLVPDMAVRRGQVLDFWASRTDTPEGRTVSRTVEIWLRETVMSSPDPVTAEEARRAMARRADGRKLDIFPRGEAAP